MTGFLFVPDKNLALYVKSQTDADIIPWEGFCYVHDIFTPDDVKKMKDLYPDAIVIVHPECRLSVIERADEVASTSGMLDFIEKMDKNAPQRPIIVGTEVGLIHQAQKMYPLRKISPLRETPICKTMKLTTLPKVLRALESELPAIELPDDIITRARIPLERMLEITAR